MLEFARIFAMSVAKRQQSKFLPTYDNEINGVKKKNKNEIIYFKMVDISKKMVDIASNSLTL